MIIPNSPAILYSPYNWDVTADRAFTTAAGASFKTLLTGNPTALNLLFDVSNMASTYPTKIAYRVDNQAWVVVPIAATVAVTLPAYTSAFQKRILEVVMVSSTEGGDRWVNPVTAVKFKGIDTTPTSVSAVLPVSRLISGIAFGDSITEGINTLSASGDTTNRSDALQSWAYQINHALGAEVGVVGYGRLGISIGANGGVPKFGSSWNYHASGIVRNFDTAPNFIVINLGTNDKNNSVPDATFKADYISVLNAMLTALPGTQFFLMLPFGGHYGLAMYQSVAAGSSDPTRVTVIDTTGWWSSSDAPDGVHPYGYTAQKHSTLVSNIIASKLKGFVPPPPVQGAGELVWSGTAWV
jgi:hypothetical protein